MARNSRDMASQLISIYKDEKKRFTLPKDLFKEVAGKEQLRDAYLDEVDEYLREDGYILINLITEHDLIAILRVKNITSKWQELDKDNVISYIYEDFEDEDW